MVRNDRSASKTTGPWQGHEREHGIEGQPARRERRDRDPGVARSFASGAGSVPQSVGYAGPERRRQERRRNFGRGQHMSGGFDPHGRREPRFGSGYGGYGEAPGEGAAGFGSGRTYAAEPGWGPGYGDQPELDARFRQPVPERSRSGRESLSPRRSRRGPKGYRRSDERLLEDVCERLMWDEDIDASEVSVDVKDGVVVLEGAVPDRKMKHAIEDAADACLGVKDIENRIRVTYGEHHDVHADEKPVGHDSRLSVGTPGGAGVSGMSGASSTGGGSTEGSGG